ncbi:MAG: zinc-ribbon domain-containing protein [Firmicutes bacterium]|nr:zinc-ribbon domain-containing protein [Bacillota bacterium]
MYCSKCGKHISDNDRFCSGCGSKIEQPSGEGMIADSSYDTGNAEDRVPYTLDTSEFVWDVHEFRNGHKTPEEVKVDWQQGIVTELGGEPQNEEEDLKSSKADEIKLEIKSESEDIKVESENTEIDAIREHLKTEEDKIREVREAAEKLHEAEMRKKTQEYHFKFVPAAEDEYEHIHQPEASEEDEIFERVTLDDISSDAEIGRSMQNSAMKRDTARLDKFYTFNKKNEEFQKLLDKEYERISSGKGGETELSPVLDMDIKEEKSRESEVFDPVAHLKEAEAARKAALAENYDYIDSASHDVYSEEMRRFDTTELEKDLYESSQSYSANQEPGTHGEKENSKFSSVMLDEIFGIKDDGAEHKRTEVEIKESYIGEPVQNENETGKDAQNFYEEDIRERNMSLTMELDKLFSGMEEPLDHKKEKKEKKRAKKSDNPFEQELTADNTDNYGDSDEEKRPIAGRVLLIIIIAILALELTVLGIKYFAPDSKAALFINDKISDAVTFFSELGRSEAAENDDADADGENSGVQPNEEENNEAQTVSINTIIEEQRNLYNKNIEMIISDPDIKYIPQVKYGSDKVHKTQPLTNNIIHTDDNGKVYYADKEAVGTLIAFDSGWIDYVNSKDKSIFNVIKKDSNAYKNCKAFSQNVKKTFKTLKIGEIRQDEKGYYIWARETIETKNGSKTTSDDFNWVYYMEPENEKLLIVDYYKF